MILEAICLAGLAAVASMAFRDRFQPVPSEMSWDELNDAVADSTDPLSPYYDGRAVLLDEYTHHLKHRTMPEGLEYGEFLDLCVDLGLVTYRNKVFYFDEIDEALPDTHEFYAIGYDYWDEFNEGIADRNRRTRAEQAMQKLEADERKEDDERARTLRMLEAEVRKNHYDARTRWFKLANDSRSMNGVVPTREVCEAAIHLKEVPWKLTYGQLAAACAKHGIQVPSIQYFQAKAEHVYR